MTDKIPSFWGLVMFDMVKDPFLREIMLSIVKAPFTEIFPIY